MRGWVLHTMRGWVLHTLCVGGYCMRGRVLHSMRGWVLYAWVGSAHCMRLILLSIVTAGENVCLDREIFSVVIVAS